MSDRNERVGIVWTEIKDGPNIPIGAVQVVFGVAIVMMSALVYM